MPLPTKPSPAVSVFTDGLLVHQWDLGTLSANLTNLYAYDLGGFRTNRPLVAARCTTQTFTTGGADQQIFWDTVDLNYDAMWSSSSTGQLTVNTAGVYRIYVQAAVLGALGNPMVAYICVNGTSTTNNAIGTMAPGSATTCNCDATVSLAVGATIYGFLFQSSGASQGANTQFGGCRIHALWISPQ